MKKNELTRVPTILYVFLGEYSTKFFESESECIKYYEESCEPFASICIIEYIGNFAGKNDVIGYRDVTGEHYLAACDCKSYYDYLPNENNPDVFCWQQVDGSIEWLYKMFRDKGIVFKNDIYAQIEEENQKLIKVIRQAFNTLY